MTYTIIGRCARTGRLGIGIATYSITVGRYAHSVRSAWKLVPDNPPTA